MDSNSIVSIGTNVVTQYDVLDKIKIAKFLKHLLRSRLWLLKSKNEDHGLNRTQAMSSFENQSMVPFLEYTKAVEDLQDNVIMRNIIRSMGSSLTVVSELLWTVIIKNSNHNVSLRNYTDINIDECFEILRKKSLELQKITEQTTETENLKDELHWQVFERASQAQSVVRESENIYENNTALKTKTQKLGKKISQMRQMNFIMSNLIGSFPLNEENFDQCSEMLVQMNELKSWRYYEKQLEVNKDDG